MNQSSKDELINVLVADILERMKIVQKPTITWQQFVAVHTGKITKPEIVAHANKLMNDILIDGYGSIEKYEKFLVKQQRDYEAYVRRVDRKQKQAEKIVATPPVEKPKETTLPQKYANDDEPVETPVQPIKPKSIADKIGAKRRGKTLEDIAKEMGYESVESYIFWERHSR